MAGFWLTCLNTQSSGSFPAHSAISHSCMVSFGLGNMAQQEDTVPSHYQASHSCRVGEGIICQFGSSLQDTCSTEERKIPQGHSSLTHNLSSPGSATGIHEQKVIPEAKGVSQLVICCTLEWLLQTPLLGCQLSLLFIFPIEGSREGSGTCVSATQVQTWLELSAVASTAGVSQQMEDLCPGFHAFQIKCK